MILFFPRHESSYKKMNDLMEYIECLYDKKMLIPGGKKSKIPEANILRIKKK